MWDKWLEQKVTYAGIKQRWLIVESEPLIDALNGSVVAQLFSAANRTPWFTNNTRTTHFFMFYRINLFNLLAQILRMIYVSFCSTL